MSGRLRASQLVILVLGLAVAHQTAAEESQSTATGFSEKVESLPFPPDAREVEFDATFEDVEFRSSSSLPSLAAFYRDQMVKKGWLRDDAATEAEDDSIEMTFQRDGFKATVDLDQRSDDVAVAIECEGLDFSNSQDPAKMLAAGVPQPRTYAFLQKELPRPEIVEGPSFRGDACHFKSPVQLETAFDFYLKALKQAGWRETRKAIVTVDRRYTEFAKDGVEVGVNIFADPLGSRIILSYESDVKEPVIPPLPPVDVVPAHSASANAAMADSPSTLQPAQKVVDPSKNRGVATIVVGKKTYSFPHAAAYRTKADGEKKTRLLFCDQAIPFLRFQDQLRRDGDVDVGELFTVGYPDHLILEVGDTVSFRFNSGGIAMADSFDKPESGFSVENNRAVGAIRMAEPKKLFDDVYRISATVDAAIMTPQTSINPALLPVVIGARKSLFAAAELLLPEGAGNVSSEGTQYCRTTRAEIGHDPATVAAFYRRELTTQGWTEEKKSPPEASDGDMLLRFSQVGATMSVRISGDEQSSNVVVSLLDTRKAKEDGILPEPGKGRIVLINGDVQPVVITIGKQPYRLRSAQGMMNVRDAVNYTVAPGTYKLKFTVAGRTTEQDDLPIAAGSTWGVVSLPGGSLLYNRLYGEEPAGEK